MSRELFVCVKERCVLAVCVRELCVCMRVMCARVRELAVRVYERSVRVRRSSCVCVCVREC